MPRYESDESVPLPGPGDGAGKEKWVPGEFLVSLRDLQLVRALLAETVNLSFVDFDPTQEAPLDESGFQRPLSNDLEISNSLGMARFRLASSADVLTAVRHHVDSATKPEDQPGPELRAALDGKVIPVVALLALIDDVCRKRYHGWTPTTAKNMAGYGVHGTPYVSTGGASRYPQLADPAAVTISEPLIGRVFDEPNWVNVGVLDTALAVRREFHGRWLRTGPDPLLPRDPSQPRLHLSGHATFIAGMILQMAPNALLHVAEVLDPEDASASVWDVAKAMMRLDKSVQVLNLSFSCYTEDGEVPLALRRAIERLDPTTVVVAAAGNHGGNPELPGLPGPAAQMWPAAMDRVVAIGSHDREGNRSVFSPQVPWVQLTALGDDVTSTYPNERVRIKYRDGEGAGLPPEIDFTASGTATWSGTSFASALVAGYLAAHTGHGPWAAHEALDRAMVAAAKDEIRIGAIPFIKKA